MEINKGGANKERERASEKGICYASTHTTLVHPEREEREISAVYLAPRLMSDTPATAFGGELS